MDKYAGKINNFYNTNVLKRLIIPSNLFYGPTAVSFLEELIPKSNAVIIADSFLINNALFAAIQKKADAKTFFIYGEPKYSDVEDILSKITSVPSAIVAIGGGSTIDTAKAVKSFFVYGKYQRVGYDDRNISATTDPHSIPLIAAPTTPATGSEQSRYYLLFDESGSKSVGRSWNLVPDYSILVPDFLENYPSRAAVLSSFDAFIHLYETLICRNESCSIVSELSYFGIGTIISVMAQLDGGRPASLPREYIERLQVAATLGGIALSNVRTGIMHHGGERLSSQMKISHPMSLVVFYDAIMQYYSEPCKDKYKKMIARINLEAGTDIVSDVQDLIALWNRLFDHYGVIKELKTLFSAVSVDVRTLAEEILSDKVWIEKESPKPMSSADVSSIIASSLSKYVP